MSTWEWIVVAAVAAVVVLALAAVVVLRDARARRSRRLHDQFGPEYARTVEQADSRKAGEQALVEREERRQEIDVRPLSGDARERYADRWRDVQARFVDDPGGALHDADRLVEHVMADRGYPVEDFEQRAEVVSVDHADLVAGFRAAHDTYLRQMSGGVTTEELRHALVDYRSLFEELVGDRAAA